MKTMKDYDYTPIFEQVLTSADKAMSSTETGTGIQSVLQRVKEDIQRVRDVIISLCKWITLLVLFIMGVLTVILMCVILPFTKRKLLFLTLVFVVVVCMQVWAGSIVDTKLTAFYCKWMKYVDPETCKGESTGG
jgi:hypothetical protein